MPSLQDLRTRLGDVELWTPYVEEVLSRHGLLDGQHDVVAGSHPTYPTFVRGDVVVKLFGCDALPWSDASPPSAPGSSWPAPIQDCAPRRCSRRPAQT